MHCEHFSHLSVLDNQEMIDKYVIKTNKPFVID